MAATWSGNADLRVLLDRIFAATLYPSAPELMQSSYDGTNAGNMNSR